LRKRVVLAVIHEKRRVRSRNANFAHNFTAFFADLFLAFGAPINDTTIVTKLITIDLELTTRVVGRGIQKNVRTVVK
jgi:hypothetical protein